MGEKTVFTLSSGHQLSFPIFYFKGTDKNAPNVYIQANMHGPEVQGNGVIYHLINYFEQNPPLGSITLVPKVNPYGSNLKIGEYILGRYNPMNGENWNRIYYHNIDFIEEFFNQNKHLSWNEIKKKFKEKLLLLLKEKRDRDKGLYQLSHEFNLAYQIQSMAHQADIVLDLHTAAKGVDHIYCPEYALNSAKNFYFPFIVSIPHKYAGALDEVTFCPWVKLHEIGQVPLEFESFTIELGNQESLNLKKAQKQASHILNYLSYKKVINKNISIDKKNPMACFLKDYITLYSPKAGIFDFKDVLGKNIHKGDCLGHYLNSKENLVIPLKSPHNGIAILHYPSATIHQGEPLYKFFTKPFEVK